MRRIKYTEDYDLKPGERINTKYGPGIVLDIEGRSPPMVRVEHDDGVVRYYRQREVTKLREIKSPMIIVFYDNKGKMGTMETDKFKKTYAHRTEFLSDAVERFNREKEISGGDTIAKIEFKENSKQSYYTEEEKKDPKVSKMIKDLADAYGDSNEAQGKMVQILKGIAFSDDPKANEFMKALDKWTTQQSKKMSESKSLSENYFEQRAEELMIMAAEDAGIDNPDPEELYWGGPRNEILMYGLTSLYPDEELRRKAKEAWRDYQNS